MQKTCLHRHLVILSAEVPADKVDALTIPYTVIGEVNADAVFAYKEVKLTEADAEAAWKETTGESIPRPYSGAEGQEVQFRKWEKRVC